ncbi:aggregation-promoting factor C-terminal-like domain-containing protein [Georgenia ruanii]|uniref:aggregation-promoting factor C-terminal-like domain-containing protein n=1 Tax=Georgenia ruanii TaxID=348442 RepID=UPI00186B3A6A|nr:G5 domain-containing protein [Georgenia ruanii]
MAGPPAPGSRRALREAAQGAERGSASFGLPTPAVHTLRAGVLGAVVVGTGAFALTQGPDLPAADISADAGTLAMRSGDVASRSQVDGRAALAAQGARTFTATVDGEDHEVISAATTLGQAFAEAGIVVGADDVVSAPLSGQVPDGGTVTVTRVVAEHVTEETLDKFATVEKQDASLPEGERKVQTAGIDGVATHTYVVKKAGDKEVSRELVASVVATVKVDEVVLVGTKKAAPAPAAGLAVSGDARAIGRQLAAARGWGADQFSCLDSLWTKESNWNVYADNPTSSAYGIPQALPGSKMASAGADWATNPATQITWGLNYIAGRYGTPCSAWSHSKAVNWY